MRPNELAQDVSVSVIQPAARKLPVDQHVDSFLSRRLISLPGCLQRQHAKRRWLNPRMRLLGIGPAHQFRVVAKVVRSLHAPAAISYQPTHATLNWALKRIS